MKWNFCLQLEQITGLRCSKFISNRQLYDKMINFKVPNIRKKFKLMEQIFNWNKNEIRSKITLTFGFYDEIQ